MKNFSLIKNFIKVENLILEERDAKNIVAILKFLIFFKKEFFLQQNQFFSKIEVFIKKINSEFLKENIYLFFEEIKKNKDLKFVATFYDKIFVFLVGILNKKEYKAFLCKTANNLDFEKINKLKKILYENEKKVFLIIHKVDNELYSGFQIYKNEERLDFSWRKVFNTLFKKIEKNYLEE